ncbi:MAG: ribosome maturation factor RimP [Porticoccaceae bacterium]|jgi:ribosome maturation factor RimP
MGHGPFFVCQEGAMAVADGKIKELLQPVIEALGCQLWGIDLQSGAKTKLLRVFIDREDGLIGIEDCEKVSRQSSSILDVEDVINGEYILEVSSPGMDRPLYEIGHYQKYIGEDISLKLRFPYEGRRNFKGRLTAIDGDEIIMVATDHEFLFPIEAIERANVVPRF